MKVQYLSDLHVDFSKHKFDNVNNADVLIIAGDLGNGGSGVNNLIKEQVCEKWDHVIMVAGNHEYYSSRKGFDYSATYRKYENQHENFHFLDNEIIVIDGIKFYGGTMWTDLSRTNPLDKIDIVTGMNDYLFTSESYTQYQFQQFCLDFDYEADVIISHHAPHYNSISEKFRSSN